MIIESNMKEFTCEVTITPIRPTVFNLDYKAYLYLFSIELCIEPK